MSEIIYILTNPVMPDLIKIGRTINLDQRIKLLSGDTGVPVPFECYFACEVEDAVAVEKRIHFGFGDHRINPKREFFRINPERIKVILEGFSLGDVTPKTDVVEDEDDLHTLKRANSRRPIFRFSLVEIPIGAKLHFIKDEEITCTVVSDKQIEFEGKVTLLSDAARILLHRGGGTLSAAQGPLYWLYDNETLVERRIRLEEVEGE